MLSFIALCLLAFQSTAVEEARIALLEIDKSAGASAPLTAVWRDETAMSSPEEVDVLYVVTEPWCAPCRANMAMLKRLDIPYTKLSVAEHRDAYSGSVPAAIPYMFIVDKSKPNSRFALHGLQDEEKLKQWASSFTLDPRTAERTMSICEVQGDLTTDAVFSALVTHLAREEKLELPMGGMLDIKVPVPRSLTDILVSLTYAKQMQVKGGRVTISWEKVAFEISDGHVQFLSPITVRGSVLGASLSADLTGLKLAKDGRAVTLELDGFIDLRIVFKE